MHVVTPAPGTFTPQELERLAVYRAAVAAGFYTDGQAQATDPAPGDEAVEPGDPGATAEQLGR